MILGTVQLGTDYGISNKTGKPGLDTVFEILDTAYSHGIQMLDTAPVYGDAESRIGQYFRKYGQRFLVSTKLPDKIPDGKNLPSDLVERAVRESLRRLCADKICCYYLHQFCQCKNEKLMQALSGCRDKGLIEKTGVSIYHPDELIYICENMAGMVDVVQIPFNIFSVAIWQDALELARRSGIKIYARSIFLQGFAFLDEQDDFVKKAGAVKYLSFIHALSLKRGTSIAQTCYDAVSGADTVGDVLIGCETAEQLLVNVRLQDTARPLTKDEQRETALAMKDIPKDILNPQTWPQYR